MTDPGILREIQRLMDESRGAMRDPHLNERRIAGLLGIDAATESTEDKDEGGRLKDEAGGNLK